MFEFGIVTVDEMLAHIDENVCVELIDTEGERLALYDGRNAFDDDYDTWVVLDFQVSNGCVCLWVDEQVD